MRFVAIWSKRMLAACCGLVWGFLAGAAIAQTPDVQFASPTGNINCTINQFVVACQIDQLTPTYTDRPDDCAGTWGQYFYLSGNGVARIGCLTQDTAGAEDTLPYGASIEVAQITCVSRINGMTCTNAQGGGFFLRRAEQRIF